MSRATRALIAATAIFIFLTAIIMWKVFFNGFFLLPLDVLFLYEPWIADTGSAFELVQNPDATDGIDEVYAWRRLTELSAKQGAVPLWDPYTFSGRPFAANNQAAVFYPLNIFFFLTSAEKGFGWTIALHILLAGIGAFLFLRRHGLRFDSSILGAVAFAFSGRMLTATNELMVISTLAWYPIILIGVDVVLERRKLTASLAFALPVGLMLLAGTLQVAQYGLLLAFFYCLFRLASGNVSWRNWKRLTGGLFHFGLMVGAGLLLAAVQIIPTLTLWRQCTRADFSYADVASPPFMALILAFFPDIFPNEPLNMSSFPFFSRYEIYFYIGIFTLFLALIAFSNKEKPLTRFFFWVGAVGALLSIKSPLFLFVYYLTPGGKTLCPYEYVCVFTIGFCFAAAFVFDRRFDEAFRIKIRESSRKKYSVYRMLGGAAALLASIFFLTCSNQNDVTLAMGRMLFLSGLYFILLGASILKGAGKFTPKLPVIRTIFVAIVAFDLVFVGIRFTSQVNPDVLGEDPPTFNYLKSLNPEEARIIRFDPFSNEETYSNILPPNLSVLAPVPDVQGYDTFIMETYGRVVDLIEPGMLATKVGDERIREIRNPEALSSPVLNMLGVTHILSKGPIEKPGIKLVAKDSIYIYKNENALPRAFFVERVEVLGSDREALEAMSDPTFDPANTMFLSGSDGEERLKPYEGEYCNGEVLDFRLGINKAWLKVRAACRAMLFYSDSYYPGWVAYVDGEPVEILRANNNFKAIALEAGDHEVRFVFKPKDIFIAGGLGLATLLIVVAAIGWELKLRAKGGHSSLREA